MSSFDAQLAALGLVLPTPPKPVATYIPVVRTGDLLFLSGMIPLRDGTLAMAGKLGQDVLLDQGYEAAKLCVLNALAVVRQELGTLNRVKRVVRLVGYVASTGEFIEHPAVVNGASDLLVKIFGDVGRHARVAIGAPSLPLNAPVEIELILQVSIS